MTKPQQLLWLLKNQQPLFLKNETKQLLKLLRLKALLINFSFSYFDAKIYKKWCLFRDTILRLLKLYKKINLMVQCLYLDNKKDLL